MWQERRIRIVHALNLYILRMKVIIASIPDDQPDLRASLGIEINEAQLEINDLESKIEISFNNQLNRKMI